MDYYVYVIYSEHFDKYYIGQTNNPKFRLSQHNSEKAGFTKRYQPWSIIYAENFKTRSEAVKSEKYLKSLKNKERLKQYIAGWRSSILRGP